ncbi:formate dehydrogenase subunit delta [Acidocella sp.]|uniref:formate dehydrogenase subunit delta n=1 Tax=Acidocella sp. TaxID=50710 RepID=UPI0026274702|nr:formate dehydrogenase subunit delta [Acidocella sp.]
MSHEKLVYMANQIGQFFQTQPNAQAEAEIADHINAFWEKRMRAQILAHLASGGAGLDERVRAALTHVKPG